MAHPSDLIAHYSSRIFQIRIYALTLVGAVLAGSIEWIKEANTSNIIGLLLILIVGSLSASNRRYTHSYLCACIASSSRESKSNEVASWYLFRHMNEHPWSDMKEDSWSDKSWKARVKSWKPRVERFMLYWSTYIPGIFAGEYLIFRGSGPVVWGWIGTVISIGLLIWWIFLTLKPLNTEKIRPSLIIV